MNSLACALLARGNGAEADLRDPAGLSDGAARLHPASVHRTGEALAALGRDAERRFLLIVAPTRRALPDGFAGTVEESSGVVALTGARDGINAAALRHHFPWTAPVSLRDRRTTIGCGDRLGRATPGQIAATRRFGVGPVLAQQSMRELSLTGRTYRQVVDDACFGVFQCDYRDGYGADGDHLKTLADIDEALAAGMPMITLDLSEVMNPAATEWDAAAVDEAWARLPAAFRDRAAAYGDGCFSAGRADIVFAPGEARRCAVMYGEALAFAERVHGHLEARRGAGKFDLEISIDETTVPTPPPHHFFIARELRARGVSFTSLAPRFVGEFQKAIDYIGDTAEFDRQFAVHAAIADACGGYKLSIHSGSDKFAVYPSIGRWTEGRLHLKTAGTSWLEAVAVIARSDPALYRELHAAALAAFPDMKKLYHVAADPGRIPPLSGVADAGLPGLTRLPDARQLLHIAYGPILTEPLRERFFRRLDAEEDVYAAALERHFASHLAGLGLGGHGEGGGPGPLSPNSRR